MASGTIDSYARAGGANEFACALPDRRLAADLTATVGQLSVSGCPAVAVSSKRRGSPWWQRIIATTSSRLAR